MNANLYLLMKPTYVHAYVHTYAHKVIIPDLTMLENVHNNQHERDQKNFAHSIIALASHKHAPEYAYVCMYVRTSAGKWSLYKSISTTGPPTSDHFQTTYIIYTQLEVLIHPHIIMKATCL